MSAVSCKKTVFFPIFCNVKLPEILHLIARLDSVTAIDQVTTTLSASYMTGPPLNWPFSRTGVTSMLPFTSCRPMLFDIKMS